MAEVVRRWTALRKLELIDEVRRGRMTAAQALEVHGVSDDELVAWTGSFQANGLRGLKVGRARSSTGDPR